MVNIQIYEKNEVIITDGSIGEELYFIEEGRVQVYKENENGFVEIAQLDKGQYFGEMALIYDSPRSASVKALTETRLKAIQREDFNDLLQNADLRTKFLGQIFNRIVLLNSRLKRYESETDRLPKSSQEFIVNEIKDETL